MAKAKIAVGVAASAMAMVIVVVVAVKEAAMVPLAEPEVGSGIHLRHW